MKYAMRLLCLVPAALLLLLASETKTDYRHSTDFSRYKTYSWMKVEAENSLWTDRIQRYVEAELATKGWQKVSAGGDASVAAVGSTKNQQRLETFYSGFGDGWFWRGLDDGVATTTVEDIPIGSLIVDIFDSGSKTLIWRGSGEKALSGDPKKNQKKLRDIVAEMFKHFPPPAKG